MYSPTALSTPKLLVRTLMLVEPGRIVLDFVATVFIYKLIKIWLYEAFISTTPFSVTFRLTHSS